MDKLIIGILIVVIILVIVLVSSGKKNNTEEIKEEVKEDNKLNQADVDMMRGINAGGFTAKKVQQSDITIPDFKRGEPIGYKDTSHVLNNTGDHIANNANQNNRK